MARWRKSVRVLYQCGYHLVWTPKYRYRILQGEIKEYVENKINNPAASDEPPVRD